MNSIAILGSARQESNTAVILKRLIAGSACDVVDLRTCQVAAYDDEHNYPGADANRHFGLECENVDALRVKRQTAGVATEDGRPAPWRRFFVRDPFGNRIEIHEPGGLRA